MSVNAVSGGSIYSDPFVRILPEDKLDYLRSFLSDLGVFVLARTSKMATELMVRQEAEELRNFIENLVKELDGKAPDKIEKLKAILESVKSKPYLPIKNHLLIKIQIMDVLRGLDDHVIDQLSRLKTPRDFVYFFEFSVWGGPIGVAGQRKF